MGVETLLAAPGVAPGWPGGGGGGLWIRGSGFWWCWDEPRCASAVARSAMKVVAATSMMTVGASCWALQLTGIRCQALEIVEDVRGVWVCAAGLGLGLGLGYGLAAGWARGVALGLGGCLAVGLGGGWVFGSAGMWVRATLGCPAAPLCL